jgi:hypothetical protein
MCHEKKGEVMTAFDETISSPEHPYLIGENYFIRTVTYHYTGKLLKIYDRELVLTDAAWIANDGRFMQAVATGDFSEVEPYPDGRPVIIPRDSVIDAVPISFPLPRAQK